ncbi:ferredoxin--NADP reductase [Pleomorphovibrio marinus]|uniref:ferredoxin--NADP reductase n=1 Tax=Pleomorphovibrio marinus TaxID=2164132 RepID=UPI000E0AD27A|nr:ferredoxin--NADP reductase [Pleomorphovibrio marinus]
MFNLFNKDKEKKESANQPVTLRIREVVKETNEAITIYFDQPEPHLDYKPGQFLTVIIHLEGKEHRRSYSLCTSPYVDPFPGITVKRLKGGLVSNYLNDYMHPGKKVSVLRPMGGFITPYHSAHRHHYGMIAAGSGITPIMGLIKSILINEPESKVSLLYGSRSESQIIFFNALDELLQKYPDRLQVIHQLTQPGPDWQGARGRIVAENLQSFINELEQSDGLITKYFLCGPEGMMELSKSALQSAEVPKDQVISESFYMEKKETLSNGNESALAVTQPVTVILEGQSYTFDVTPDKTILEAGLDEEIEMPYSCQSGLCTACRGRLLSGEVKMDEDAGLSENEIAEGYILCCSSKPKSGEIKINIE